MTIRQLSPVLLLIGIGGFACSRGADSLQTDPEKSSGKPFELSISAPSGGAVNQKLFAAVQVVPRGDYKINLEYPHKLSWSGPETSMPRSAELKAKQASKLNAAVLQFKPAFQLGTEGKHAFTGTVRFSVCTEKQCELKSETVSWVTNVK